MSGLGGMAGHEAAWPAADRTLADMARLERDHGGPRGPIGGVSACCAVSRDGVVRGDAPSSRRDNLSVWFDGELYAAGEARSGADDIVDPTDHAACAGALAAALAARDSDAALARLDGRFVAVAHDADAGTVSLIADRLGHRFLFWAVVDGMLVWSTMLGSLIAVPGFEPRIDSRAVREFAHFGHLLKDRTWFVGVEAVSPGTVLTFDLRTGRVSRRRYWWWDELRRLDSPPDEAEAARELARLFREAVEARCAGRGRLGVYLSGGLDSRAVIGALAGRPVKALSFGVRDCLDVQIAERVCERLAIPLATYELTAANWLAPRVPAVWRTGGMVNLAHLHGIEAVDLAAELFDVGFEGWGGDDIMRGDCLQTPEVFDRFDRARVIAGNMGDESFFLDLDEYAGLDRSEYIYIDNGSRRLLAATAEADEVMVRVRRPFSANRVIEFVYSLPDRMRYRGRLYKAMLLHAFPELYTDIAWASTGVPISWVRGSGRLYRYRRRMEKRLTGNVSAVGALRRGPRHYADYGAWLLTEPSRRFVERLLLNPSSLAAEYLPFGAAQSAWEALLAGRDTTDLLGRYLTMEIWLRQVYESWAPDWEAM